MPGLNCRVQHGELGVEPDRRRHTGHGEHQQQHHEGKPRAALVESLEVVEIVRLETFTRQQHDHAEAAQAHQHIDHCIEHGGTVTLKRSAQHADEQKSHVGNGRIREHALDVGLRDGGDVTHRHRQHGQDHQHPGPVDHQRLQRFYQKAHDESKGRQFGCGADEHRHRGRCALIYIGHPHMEGDSANLERQSCHDEGQTEHQQLFIRCALMDDFGNAVHVQRAGRAIKHGHAIEQKTGGHCAEDEVFHRRFGCNCRVALQRNQGIQAQCKHFQSEIQGEEVTGGYHHHHAQRGKQDQRQELAGEQSARHQIAARIHQHHGYRQVGQQLEYVRHEIIHEHMVEHMHDAVLMRRYGDQRATQQGELHQQVSECLGVIHDEQIRDEDCAHHHKQEYLCVGRGQGGEKIHVFLNSKLWE